MPGYAPRRAAAAVASNLGQARDGSEDLAVPAGPGREGAMIAHKLVSSGQLLVVQLDAGQAVWCQPGRFVWKTPNVDVQARMIGSGGEGGGLLDRALATAISAGRRRLAGGAAALPYFAATGSSGLVAFAGDAGGPIQELHVEPDRGWLVARDALVAAERTVGLGPAPNQPAGSRSPQGWSGSTAAARRSSLAPAAWSIWTSPATAAPSRSTRSAWWRSSTASASSRAARRWAPTSCWRCCSAAAGRAWRR